MNLLPQRDDNRKYQMRPIHYYLFYLCDEDYVPPIVSMN